MIIGFTGTRDGTTTSQITILEKYLMEHEISQAHHGDCRGADEEFHHLIYGRLPIMIFIHPPTNKSKRAFCKGGTILPKNPYITRNHDIVNACEVLIACPKTDYEQIRSGTWATVRHARRTYKPIVIIYPDGTMCKE